MVTIDKGDVERHPRQSETFENVAPDVAHAFRAMCNIEGLNSGDYLTKLMKAAVAHEQSTNSLKCLMEVYERKIFDDESAPS